jgi:ABC-type oligopeptide transport system ATPase subunit
MSTTLLSVENLSLSLHGQPILKGLSFQVEAGEILGLVGESGSGKSLTALSILGLTPSGSVAGGAVKLDGQDLLNRPDRELQAIRGEAIGIVFQEPATALNPLLTSASRWPRPPASTAIRKPRPAPWPPRRWPAPACLRARSRPTAIRTNSPGDSGSGRPSPWRRCWGPGC